MNQLTAVLYLILFLNLSITIDGKETVRVNIVGYPRLDEFTMILNQNSQLIIDGKLKPGYRKITVYPNRQSYSYRNQTQIKFKTVFINTGGLITIDCIHGTQNYEGSFKISRLDKNIQIINTIPLDDYFASVLGAEMGGTFSGETLKAQAIAIRTYYQTRKNKYHHENYDINNADGMDMVYRGVDFAGKKMYAAFQETAGLYLVDKKGKPGLPLFHSTSGGLILKDEVMDSKIDENIPEPVVCSDLDENGTALARQSPYFSFSIVIPHPELVRAIRSEFLTGQIIDYQIKYFSGTSCVDFIGFTDQEGILHWIKGYKFLSMVHKAGYHLLRSIQFRLERIGDDFYFSGQGFGHQCGMSQYSAETLAKKGFSYIQILKKYYPQYRVKKLP